MGTAQEREDAEEKEGFVDELKPGTKLMHGQYTIDSFLNAGGFGITYLARDSLERKIVIKECFPGAFCRRSRYVVQARSRAHQNELKSIVRLFVQEARSLAKLDHPNIVGVHQVFEDNDTAYMALDFVEGRDLLDTIEDPNHGLTPAQIKVILKEVLGAVGFIHERGILHRDISPDNILINEQFHPVLIDFGAAREEASKQTRVLSTLRVVKDGYSPQEFYIAGSPQSPSSDLYALAASFYHLIAKDVPPNSQARLAAIASTEPDPYVPLAGGHPEYDDSFLAAIDLALAVFPKDRLQSAQEWLDMMDGITGNVTPLKVATAAPGRTNAAPAAEGQSAPKSKMPLLLGSAAVVAILIGAGVMMMSGGEDAPTPAPAAVTPAESASIAPEQPAATVAAVASEAEQPTAPSIEEEAPAVIATENIATPAEEAETVAQPEEVAEAPLPEPAVTPHPVVVEPAASTVFPEQNITRPVADTETAVMAFPDTPDAIDAVGSGPTVDIAAVTPGNELPPEYIVSSWSVQLPFDAASPDSNVIGEIGEITPTWVRPGLEVTSVNGTAIDSISEISTTLLEDQAADPGDTMQVAFGTRDPATGETAEHDWVMPVIYQVALLDGTRFQSAFAGSGWRTSVVEVPENVTTDLRTGDVMTAYIPTSENITDRDTLAKIIERELISGTDHLMFAVQREGSMWVASLPLVGLN